MSSRPAWSTRASSVTGSEATEKPCLKKQTNELLPGQSESRTEKLCLEKQNKTKVVFFCLCNAYIQDFGEGIEDSFPRVAKEIK